jgi:TfoX/Sxy family transcriptional regulator of competence genes
VVRAPQGPREKSMAFDAHLAARVRKALGKELGITEKRMFGGIAFLRHGLMFAGVTNELLMARVGRELHEDSLAREHVRVMDFTGKPMAGYVYVDPPALASEKALGFWLKRCLDHVATLPPKKK